MNHNKVSKFLMSIIFIALIAPVFSQPADQVQLVSEPKDKSYDRMHIDDLKPIPYPYLGESDIFWEMRIWRVIDFREKINQALYFPETPQGRWISLMQLLWDSILGGEITAYDFDPSTDNFESLIPLTANEIETQLTDTVSVPKVDPNDPNNIIIEKVALKFNPQDVLRLRIKEDWIFDKHRSEMMVRIVGICPVKEDRDPETNEFRGYQPLFWLYYPELRPILARFEVFNRHNSARRLTYDQFFLQRRFSSYIIKEDNVFNRSIADYASGLDNLLEAERIKEDIRKFENELWVY